MVTLDSKEKGQKVVWALRHASIGPGGVVELGDLTSHSLRLLIGLDQKCPLHPTVVLRHALTRHVKGTSQGGCCKLLGLSNRLRPVLGQPSSSACLDVSRGFQSYLIALESTVFDQICHHDNDPTALLHNHLPKVTSSGVFGTLGANEVRGTRGQ
jgi:hypothetical protein